MSSRSLERSVLWYLHHLCPPHPSLLVVDSFPLRLPSVFRIHPFCYYLLHSLTVPFLLLCLMSPSLKITHHTNGRGSISDSCNTDAAPCSAQECMLPSARHFPGTNVWSALDWVFWGNALQVPRVWPWCGSHAQVFCSLNSAVLLFPFGSFCSLWKVDGLAPSGVLLLYTQGFKL